MFRLVNGIDFVKKLAPITDYNGEYCISQNDSSALNTIENELRKLDVLQKNNKNNSTTRTILNKNNSTAMGENIIKTVLEELNVPYSDIVTHQNLLKKLKKSISS